MGPRRSVRSLLTVLGLLCLVGGSAIAHPGAHRRKGPLHGPFPPPGWLARGAADLTLAGGPLADRQPSATSKWIYLALDDHTDYLWTQDEADYRDSFLAMLDFYLDRADATAGNASPYQSRFNTDGSFWLWTYEQNRSASDFQRLIDRLRSGHIGSPRNTLVEVYGGQPAEAVLRGLYYSGRLERRYHLAFPLAIAMENQTMPFGLGSLWAGSGVRYAWQGICGCASQVEDAWNREHDAYRWLGRDGSSILVKWNSMLLGNQSLGGYAEARDPVGSIAYVDGNASFQARYPYPVIGIFGYGWDDAETFRSDFPEIAAAQTTASRQIVVSNEVDYFADLEANHGGGLPALAVSYGNEWELMTAAIAEVSARMRRSVEKLRAAEALATLVARIDPTFLAGREAARDLAFLDLGLFWEHDLGGDGAVPAAERAAFQVRLADEIAAYVDDLYADAVAALGSRIGRSGTLPRYFVFNPLSFARDEAADLPYSGPFPAHVVDLATETEVPSQQVSVFGQTRFRILASDVPSVGYRVYEVRSGAGEEFGAAASADAVTGVLESSRYRLTLAPRGAISSWIDHAAGDRELVSTISGRTANDLGAGTGTLAVENAGAVSVTLKATATTPIQHLSRLTLIRGSDRVEIDNQITQNFTDTRTWAFSFALAAPRVRHEEVGAVLLARLRTDALPGDYSERNARYDWLSLNHFADASDGVGGGDDFGVTLSNADLDFFQLGASTTALLDTATPQLKLLAGGRLNGLGLPSQNGVTSFLQRFALRAHSGWDPAAAMRFALAHQNPLAVGAVGDPGGADYPEAEYSFVSVSDPDVLLWSLKPAEEGIAAGIIARLWNLAAAPVAFTLTLAEPLSVAEQVTHVETRSGPGSLAGGELAATAQAQQLLTFRLGAYTAEIFSDSFERGSTVEWSETAP